MAAAIPQTGNRPHAQAKLPETKSPLIKKTAQEIEVERLSALPALMLTAEDLKRMERVKQCRNSLIKTEMELSELKETRKLKQTELETAIAQLCDHAHNRQLALKF